MIFEVRDGGFGYSSHECILKNVNFSLDEPQVLSVLGANGAGKTTLLKCMLGLLEWNTGGTFVDGVNIKDMPYNQLWQRIGYVPQAKASAFAYSTLEMVLLGRNAHLGTFRQPKKRDWEIAEACMVLETIERLCREKHISAVVNTHYPEHALSISQKALLLTAHGTTLFGPTAEILSEEHLNDAFGVEVRLYPLTLRNRTYTCVLPLGLKERMERGA